MSSGKISLIWRHQECRRTNGSTLTQTWFLSLCVKPIPITARQGHSLQCRGSCIILGFEMLIPLWGGATAVTLSNITSSSIKVDSCPSCGAEQFIVSPGLNCRYEGAGRNNLQLIFDQWQALACCFALCWCSHGRIIPGEIQLVRPNRWNLNRATRGIALQLCSLTFSLKFQLKLADSILHPADSDIGYWQSRRAQELGSQR